MVDHLPLIGDSQAARDATVKPGATARTRHFERATPLVKRLYSMLIVAPFLVVTDMMPADIFTKALEKDKFYKFRDYILNVDNGPEVVLYGKAARLFHKLQRAISR